MAPYRGILVLLAAALLAPAATATFHEDALPEAGAQDLNARALHVLQYHPYPDPEGDPWGLPEIDRNGTRVGYMEGRYGAYWYPTLVTDGVLKIEGATTFLDTYNALEADFVARRAEDAPLRIALHAVRDADQHVLAGQVDVRAKNDAPPANLTLRIVVYEDDVPYDGGNGVNTHRFTVRALAHHDALTLHDGTATVPFMARLDPGWNPERIGVVASVHHHATTHPQFEQGEVLQAATYRLGQDGPTIQHTRGVLLEGLTATWCAACVYGDGAVDELANAYGHPSSRLLDREWTYLRVGDPAPLAGAVLIGLAASALAWSRNRGERP